MSFLSTTFANVVQLLGRT